MTELQEEDKIALLIALRFVIQLSTGMYEYSKQLPNLNAHQLQRLMDIYSMLNRNNKGQYYGSQKSK